MWLDKVYHNFERAVSRISHVANNAGACVLVMMMCLVTMDVLLRYAVNRPVKGAFELVEFMMVSVTCLGMAYTGIKKGHVAVELLVSRFSPRVQAIFDSFNWFVSMGLFFLISWKAIVHAKVIWDSGLISSILSVPVFPFLFVLALGSGLLCLVFLVDFIHSVSRVLRK